ncbi:hypothetical protein BT67DRAFT_441010 [Trichocladium antarcticum]|uniref:Uncharacterized protein n=1 Tax=Trichocladium antarcticum TaxID=1450529 RepID=A0AAN6ZEF9_9PEZI|nr:hypothetical protein BT67DRAFT_441010 [Trichocladium antarcticum]
MSCRVKMKKTPAIARIPGTALHAARPMIRKSTHASARCTPAAWWCSATFSSPRVEGVRDSDLVAIRSSPSSCPRESDPSARPSSMSNVCSEC